MTLSAFPDRGAPPDAAALRDVLGHAHGLWTELAAWVRGQRPGVAEEWAYPGARYGWSLRLREKGRVLIYLTPCRGEFLVGVVLGEKAIAAARERGAPAEALALAEQAPRYAEGRGVRLTVGSTDALSLAIELAGIKLAG